MLVSVFALWKVKPDINKRTIMHMIPVVTLVKEQPLQSMRTVSLEAAVTLAQFYTSSRRHRPSGRGVMKVGRIHDTHNCAAGNNRRVTLS